jgi:hypothetical protein
MRSATGLTNETRESVLINLSVLLADRNVFPIEPLLKGVFVLGLRRRALDSVHLP